MNNAKLGITFAVLGTLACILGCKSATPASVPAAYMTRELAVGGVRSLTLLDSESGGGASNARATSTGKKSTHFVAQWATGVLKSDGWSLFNGIDVDSDGNVYAVGRVGPGKFKLSNEVGVNGQANVNTAVIAKYDTSGVPLWIRGGFGGDCEFYSVAVDGSGNAYAVGVVAKGSFDFDSGAEVEGYRKRNLVLVKYDKEGSARWARTVAKPREEPEFGGDGETSLNAVAVDRKGNIYAAGGYIVAEGGKTDFDHKDPGYAMLPYKTVGGGMAMVVKFDSAGTALWVSGPNAISRYNAIVTDGSDNVYAVGEKGTSSEPEHAFLTKYHSSGTELWERGVKSEGTRSAFRAVGLDAKGDIYATGDMAGSDTIDFGNGVTATAPSEKGSPVLVKYLPSGMPQWARSAVSGGGNFTFHAAAVGDDYVYLTGVFGIDKREETYDFGGGISESIKRYRQRPTGGWETIFGVPITVSYDPLGIPKWVTHELIGVRALRLDKEGNAFVAGDQGGTVDFGNGVTISNPEQILNLCVVKYAEN